MEAADIMIIGAGHAGVALATEIRRRDAGRTIALLNGERDDPYHRPPLSKAWLGGTADESSGWLQPPGSLSAAGVDVVSGRVASVDVNQRRVLLEDGRALHYSELVFATGSVARRLPITDHRGVRLLTLRSSDDARELKAALGQGARLAIIGTGFIGLEVAATASRLGVDVTLLGRDPRVLSRVASPHLSEYLTDLHRSHGVKVELESKVLGIGAGPGGAAEVVVEGGKAVEADCVLVAIGGLPDDRLAREAGIRCADGVLVDEYGRTSADHVYAIGDVARRPLKPFQESARLESVHNANEHARIVAAALTGSEAPMPATPWFWSDQYDRKLQVAGLLPDRPTSVEVMGDVAVGEFAIEHRVDGRLVCVEAVNAAREFALGRRKIGLDAAAALA